MKYARIVFMQGEEAEEPLRILDEDGTKAAIDYLAQWDNGDEDVHSSSSAGTSDTVIAKGRYVLSFNRYIGYIGLERKIK